MTINSKKVTNYNTRVNEGRMEQCIGKASYVSTKKKHNKEEHSTYNSEA